MRPLRSPVRHLSLGVLLAALLAAQIRAAALPPPVRIAQHVGGHIHPSLARTSAGDLIVIYGRINHRDLRITRSTNEGQTWSQPVPYEHTVDKTYYPGSLTTLRDGRILHAWNHWASFDSEEEPRSVAGLAVQNRLLMPKVTSVPVLINRW